MCAEARIIEGLLSSIAFGFIFLIGRLMHAYCFAFTKNNMFLRIAGTALTLGCILSIALILFIYFI